MFDFPFVRFIDALHNQLHQQRAFAAQFTEIDIHPCMAEIRRVLIFQKVLHFDVQHFRLMGVTGVETVKTSVLANHREIRFTRKPFCRGFHPDYIFRPVRFSGNNPITAQVHILHR